MSYPWQHTRDAETLRGWANRLSIMERDTRYKEAGNRCSACPQACAQALTCPGCPVARQAYRDYIEHITRRRGGRLW